MTNSLPRRYIYILGVILLINLLQAYFTPLIFDEAYYWYYAKNLAWGYFDHPPMVAFIIKAGSLLFSGELGVRLISCFLGAGTLYLIWEIVRNKRKEQFVVHFFVLVMSMTLLNAYGFFTLPDTPLLFFTALFLRIYQKFTANANYFLAIVLGLVMAALMYSKYHAVLVILFVILSNLKLLYNKFAWLAVAIALLAYIPHLLWLYENDFISINYHLFERPNRAYEFGDFTLGYFLNLIVLFGLTFPWIYLALFKTRSKDLFSRALLFLSYGVLLFFLVSSIQRRVQTQWLIVVCIPMAIIVYEYLLDHPIYRKWIYRMGIANLIVLGYLRLGLIFEPLFPIVYETHGNKEWVKKITDEAGDIPVVFENSYRNASMFSFYSGNTSYSLNNIMFRKNQYSIDQSEEAVQGKKVLFVSKFPKTGDFSYHNAKGTKYMASYMDNFESYRKLQCLVEERGSYPVGEELEFTVLNPYLKDIPLEKLRFGIVYLNSYKQVLETALLETEPKEPNLKMLKARSGTTFLFKRPAPPVESPAYFKISISENGFYWGLNGNNVKLN